ncbi:MAG: hypothetical protein WAV46_02185 [Candidatus Moraniibacteriota bacterium]
MLRITSKTLRLESLSVPACRRAGLEENRDYVRAQKISYYHYTPHMRVIYPVYREEGPFVKQNDNPSVIRIRRLADDGNKWVAALSFFRKKQLVSHGA